MNSLTEMFSRVLSSDSAEFQNNFGALLDLAGVWLILVAVYAGICFAAGRIDVSVYRTEARAMRLAMAIGLPGVAIGMLLVFTTVFLAYCVGVQLFSA